MKFSSLMSYTRQNSLLRDKSVIFLCLLGAFLTLSYSLNYICTFDDLYLPSRFETLVSQYGYLKTIGILISNADMPTEYRTYGLSRLLQFAIWVLFGKKSLVYPIIISISQFFSAILLLIISRKQRISETVALTIALVWMLSPFAVTWTFHHYSYLILPFQVIVLMLFFVSRLQNNKYRYVISVLFGIAIALTGESQLITAAVVIICLMIISKVQKERGFLLSIITTVVIVATLHRLYWVFFVKDLRHHQRFEDYLRFDFSSFPARFELAFASIIRSASEQVTEIFRFGGVVGLVIGALVASVFFWVTRRRSESTSTGRRALFGLLVLAISSLSLYVLLEVLTGQSSHTMPRRYGFVPLTLLTAVLVLLLGELVAVFFRQLGDGRRVGYGLGLAIVAAAAGQFHLGAVPNEREIDKSIAAKIVDGDTNNRLGRINRGLLYFVSSDHQYFTGEANPFKVGPRTESPKRRELFESPFATYWIAQLYAVNILGYKFSAMPMFHDLTRLNSKGSLIGVKSSYPVDPGLVQPDAVDIIANLGFEEFDTKLGNIRLFHSYAEFEPYFFKRRIERNLFKTLPADEFVIDLGLIGVTATNNSYVSVDKKYSDTIKPSKSWIENYGLFSGQDSIYVNESIRGDLSEYRTNRNGTFIYRVALRQSANIEVCLDFWEQWGRLPGERAFELEVSWDGNSWADVGKVDPAAINGNMPFSIVLTRQNANIFQFRFKPSKGSIDVPMIQVVRVRKL